MFEMRLVFSYCEDVYCTQIDNKSHEELSPRPVGLSVLKILFHEHLLYDGVLYIIFGIRDEPNDILSSGLLFDQEWVGLLWCSSLGRRGLNSLPIGFFFVWVPPGL